ncbi:MAG: hypothetical protein ACI9O3_001389 [Colwellia sp.]
METSVINIKQVVGQQSAVLKRDFSKPLLLLI